MPSVPMQRRREWAADGVSATLACPYCLRKSVRVLDSRPSGSELIVRRRRACDHCGVRYTTFELPEALLAYVVNGGGTHGIRTMLENALQMLIDLDDNKKPVEALELIHDGARSYLRAQSAKVSVVQKTGRTPEPVV